MDLVPFTFTPAVMSFTALEWALAFFIFLLGLGFGSFASALAYRLPRDLPIFKNADGSFCRSACPNCQTVLKVRDLLPFFSWLLARGRCRYCDVKIPSSYPLLECGTGLMAFIIFCIYGPTALMIALILCVPLVLAIIDIDFRFKIIPDVMNLAIAGLAFLALFITVRDPYGVGYLGLMSAMLMGAVLYAGVIYALGFLCSKIVGKEALGLGDVKFFAASGLWFGAELERFTLYLMMAGFTGIFIALYLRYIKGDKEEAFAFGPALVVAFLVLVLTKNTVFS